MGIRVPDVPVSLFYWLWFALHDANVQNLAATHQDYDGLMKTGWRNMTPKLTKNPHYAHGGNVSASPNHLGVISGGRSGSGRVRNACSACAHLAITMPTRTEIAAAIRNAVVSICGKRNFVLSRLRTTDTPIRPNAIL